jgi:hypothetical protein
LQLINALKLLIKKRLDIIKVVISERVLTVTVFSKSCGLIVMTASDLFTKAIYKGDGVRKQSLQIRKINKSQSKRTAKHSCRGN